MAAWIISGAVFALAYHARAKADATNQTQSGAQQTGLIPTSGVRMRESSNKLPVQPLLSIFGPGAGAPILPNQDQSTPVTGGSAPAGGAPSGGSSGGGTGSGTGSGGGTIGKGFTL